MRGISLSMSMRMFGFKDGFTFWFKWSIRDPIQLFYWLNISHKPYCTECGFSCGTFGKCNGKKLYSKKEILEHWNKIENEMKKVEVGPNDMCVYCGEFRATQAIQNPNGGLGKWKVCVTCKNIIEEQQKLVLGMMLRDRAKSETERELAEKMIKEANERIQFWTAESFISTHMVVIRKKD